jgi:hypothetical protein
LFARIALLDFVVFFHWGSDLDGVGPYVPANRHVQGFTRPTLPRGFSCKVGHPIEPIRELKQFLSDFRDPGLPR